MQYSIGISPELRSNFDYAFLLSEDFFSNQKRLFEHWAGIFPDFNSFRLIFNQLTDDYGSMVIDNKKKSKVIFEKIYTYTAPYDRDGYDYRFEGCRQFRDFHKRNFDDKWQDKGDSIDFIDYCMKHKKDKGGIKVKKIKTEEQKKSH